ncbi:c-type cytochrome [Ramlibacter sp.]|uniref:c-type cytochrome n=1 Tax=Ramlibacter sp. TaxID=1917967 RepID=UPI0039C93CC8
MKKLMLAATALAVAAALAGCGRNDDNAADTTASTSPSTTAPASTDNSNMATLPSTSDNSTNMATAPSTSDSSTNMATAPSTSDSSTNMAAAPTTSSTTDQSSSTVASSSTGTDASNTAAMGAGASGQTVYSSTCAMCHAASVAGAPKPGDKAEWKPRIAQGKDTLYQHAINGFTGKKGMMPPKGGNTSLPDADVKAAVDYMVSQSQ